MKFGENDYLPHEPIIFNKFHEDWIKNVDFLRMANFVTWPVGPFFVPDFVSTKGMRGTSRTQIDGFSTRPLSFKKTGGKIRRFFVTLIITQVVEKF